VWALGGPGRGGGGWLDLPVNIFHPRRIIFLSSFVPINHCDKCSEGVFLWLIFATPTSVRYFFFFAKYSTRTPTTVIAANAPANKYPFIHQKSKSQNLFEIPSFPRIAIINVYTMCIILLYLRPNHVDGLFVMYDTFVGSE